MKVVILAGGYGTRLSEETHRIPKPMVEIGGWPILWHIMKIYGAHGFNEFIICLGYKGHVIKEYFSNFYTHNNDVTIDLKTNQTTFHSDIKEPWSITLVDTGSNSNTGGRIKRIQGLLNEETFCLTYGDGLSDVDITALVEFHKESKKLATVTAVQPPGRFGALVLNGDKVTGIQEKPKFDSERINGGFFVLEQGIFDYIEGDETSWEREPLEQLVKDGQFAAFKHDGFWRPMDTLRERYELEENWKNGNAPWKIW